jgi:diguanylate cyclase (GGDEF)-like protein/PAS domain S-box-containing protein
MKRFGNHDLDRPDSINAVMFSALGFNHDAAIAHEAQYVQSLGAAAHFWRFASFSRVLALAIWLIQGLISIGDLNGALLLPLILVALADVTIFTLGALLKRRKVPLHIAAWTMLIAVPISAFSFGMIPIWTENADVSQATLPFLIVESAVALVCIIALAVNRMLLGAYCVAVLIALPFGMSLAASIFAIIPFLAVLILTLYMQASQDLGYRNEIERARGDLERARRLLSDHEAAGRGWFWETDARGNLSYVSQSVANVLGATREDLVSRPLTSILLQDSARDDQDGRTLAFHMSTRSTFSDLSVRAAVEGEERWWSISGTPIFNDFGRFEGFRGSGTDLTEIRKSQHELSKLAQFDQLTGLFNRVRMKALLEQSLTTPMGKPNVCALFLLDLDRFKSVNDTLGHPAGDALLRQVAKRLEHAVGQGGQVGRIGGDEFQVVFPDQDDRQRLGTIAQQVIHSLSQPYMLEGKQVVIGASIGIAIAPNDGQTSEALVRNADLALYAAKGDGRGVHRFYAENMHSNAEERRNIENDLRDALGNNNLSLAYQPVVSAVTEKITGFEALLRWNHPVRGAVSPAEFIPIAEDAGLIATIGEWALRTACMEAAQWRGNARVAVNVSPIQFANPSFPSLVANALAQSQLRPDRLELEITESVFLNDSDSVDKMFISLKKLGIRLALDDFGTGYSSLGYLKRAPFDKIKIDQSFVRGAAAADNRNSAIITAIVSLSEAMGMETTAEGAETHDELELIRNLGCSHVQGYIYGRPMPAIEASSMLARNEGHAVAQGHKTTRQNRMTVLRSVIVAHNGRRQEARLRNITDSGAMIEGLAGVPENSWVFLDIANYGLVQANVRWAKDDRAGVQFLPPIDMALFNASTQQPPAPKMTSQAA